MYFKIEDKLNKFLQFIMITIKKRTQLNTLIIF